MLAVLIVPILNTGTMILGWNMVVLNSSCFLRSASDLLLTSNSTLNGSSRLELFPWLRSRFLCSHTSLGLILLSEYQVRASLILVLKLIKSLITCMNSGIYSLGSSSRAFISDFVNIFLNCVRNFALPLLFRLEIYFLVIIHLWLLLLLIHCIFLLT